VARGEHPQRHEGRKKAIAKQLEWLCSFEEVVLDVRHGRAGRIAVAECARCFHRASARSRTSMKDPNELLMAGRGDEIIKAIWQAKTYRPDGIVTLKDIRAKMLEPKDRPLVVSPDADEADLRSTLVPHLCVRRGHWRGQDGLPHAADDARHDGAQRAIGVFSLEQPPEETGERIAGKFAGRCFHIPDDGWTQEEKVAAIDALEASGKLFLYDSFGATDWDVIKGHIRYLNHSEGVRIFYLDHLTALAAAEDDERKGLERIMSEMSHSAKSCASSSTSSRIWQRPRASRTRKVGAS
jgi:twinkle protein